MKIVVLDGYTENPGDLSWAPLEALGEVTVYDRTSYVEAPIIAERIGDAEIVVMNKTPISKEKNHRQVPQPEGNRRSGHRLQRGGLQLRQGEGHPRDERAHLRHRLRQPVLHRPAAGDLPPHRPPQQVRPRRQLGQQCGIGAIGITPSSSWRARPSVSSASAASARLRAASPRPWAMNVLAYDLYPNDSGKAIAEYVDLDTLLSKADVVSLHCNLTPENTGLINKDTIAKMKDGAILNQQRPRPAPSTSRTWPTP